MKRWIVLCFFGLMGFCSLLSRAEEVKIPPRKPAQAVEVFDTPEAAAASKPTTAQPTTQPADPPPQTSAFEDSQNHWMISAVLSPVDYWVPGKYGILFSYMPTNEVNYEVEYLRGSFGFSLLGEDLGTVIEQRLTVQSRVFVTESFNYHAGVNYDLFEVTLKPSFSDTVTSTSSGQDYTAVELATLGVTLGVGNRWKTDSGVVIGVDWLELQMPMLRLRQYSPFIDLSDDPGSRDKVSDAIRKVRDNPRFAALKFQAGISF